MHLLRKLRTTLKQASSPAQIIPAEQALTLLQRGDDQFAAQHYAQAIKLYELANQIFVQLDDQFNQASISGRLGNTYSAMGNREQARTYYTFALDKSQTIQDHQIACAALGNLGLLAQYTGQSEQALKYFFQARDYAKTLQDTASGALGSRKLVTSVCSSRAALERPYAIYS